MDCFQLYIFVLLIFSMSNHPAYDICKHFRGVCVDQIVVVPALIADLIESKINRKNMIIEKLFMKGKISILECLLK